MRTVSAFFFKIKDLISQMDGMLAALVALCCGYGLLLITTATHSFGTIKNVIVHGGGIMLGIVAIFVIVMVDVENLSAFSKFLYPLAVVMMIATLILGTERMGNKNWIILGPVSIQPSEFVKIIFIITFATHLKKVQNYINHPKALFPLLLHFALLLGLVLMQGDLGTALVYIFICLMMLVAAGLHWLYFTVGGIIGVAALPFIFEYLLKDYQKLRILAVYDPSIDPLGYGYHTLQSKITLGSGGVSGYGLFQGVQTQYSILPEKQTDFIFSVAGEELGFFGVSIIILLLVLLLIRIMYIAKNATDNFGCYVTMGVAAMFFFQAAENIGMCIGLLPVIGITLPFFSYGGSSILTCLMGIGLVMSVNSKRKITGIFQGRHSESLIYSTYRSR
ncbi:MAG: rod shape-determining protein RodA [Clostridia bacterium]|nr:rod shape-determining protein RodA [Clostridia bacterium]